MVTLKQACNDQVIACKKTLQDIRLAIKEFNTLDKQGGFGSAMGYLKDAETEALASYERAMKTYNGV